MRIILFFILQMLLICSCVKEDLPNTNEQFELKVGDQLPAFRLNQDGTTFNSETDLKGKRSVIVFFNTTCSDCQIAFPKIQQLYDRLSQETDIVILLIARGQKADAVKDYFDTKGYQLPFFTDPKREVYSLFADQTIPRLFVANQQQTIILTQTEQTNAEEVLKILLLD